MTVRTQRHFRDLRRRLTESGFTVVESWMGRHLRIRVKRNGREVTLTCAGTPAVPEHAIENTIKQAVRGTMS